ncbi:MAG TPA: BTAD domain-containing putative transcriptional regulator [Thermoanaerobaculia bacterium]|nr:BTAD domain-containing putative transcriptional regulator [Thermoanaerobaculia bacterium]
MSPESAAARAVSAPHPSAVGLPVELTCFVGREREVEEARELLRQSRLLTLTGAGGSGKTRLAMELAARCTDDFAWVELAGISDPGILAEHVAAVLRLREEPGRSATDTLLAALRERPLLLVLDNCEHLVDACAELAGTLLRGCPELRILTTSREALGIAGERPWLVPPLSLPPACGALDAATVASSEAVQLFAERAATALRGFRLTDTNAAAVAQICHRLDGIPLAIELAAARVRVLAPEQIAARLDDAFRLLVAAGRTVLPRHRTLRETIEWSHRLLADEERVLFRRLSVFPACFELEAVEAICPGGEIGVESILDLLAALVDRSLVTIELRADQARYRLLETVRQFALGELREAGELDSLRACHAEWFTALAEEAEPRIFGGASDPAWLARLKQEEGNLRSALEWSEEDPDRAETGLRLGAALHWAWFAWGQFREGREHLVRALATGAAVCIRARARGAVAAGTAALWQGDVASARAPMEEAVEIWRGLRGEEHPGDRPHRAYALAGLGAFAALGGEPERAAPLLDESWREVQQLEPSVLTAFVLYWRGMVALACGDWELARRSLEDSAAVGRSLGAVPAIAHPLTALGRLALREGETASSSACLAEALALHQSVGDLWGAVQAIEGLAGLALGAGRHERAARLLGAVGALREGIGTPLPSPAQEAIDRLVEAAREAAGEELFDRWRDEGRELSPEEAFALAHAEAEEGRPRLGSLAARVLTEETSCACAPQPAADAPTLRLSVLGAFELRLGDELLDGRCAGRARELLAYLACHPEGRSKDQVGLALWPDASPGQVRNLFHVTLHRLRKALGRPEWIVAEGERYRLSPALGAEVDALRFEVEASCALADLRRGGDAGACLAAALDLYRGDYLEGEDAGEWHLELRSRLEELYLDGLRALGEVLVDQGRFVEAAAAFRRLLERDDLAEDVHRRLISSLARAGDRAGAIRAYRRLEELLRRELDVEPEPETAALMREIQRAEAV